MSFVFLDDEPMFSATQARRCPEYKNEFTGKQSDLSTVVRHITRGAIGRDRQRIFLPAIRKPQGWLTSRRAVQHFFNQLNASPTAAPTKARESRLRQVDSELAAAGFR